MKQFLIRIIIILYFLWYSFSSQGQTCEKLYPAEIASVSSECSAMVMTMAHDNRNLPYLYVANKEAGLTIFDISDSENPQLAASIPVQELGLLEVMNLWQEDDYLYLALGNHFTNPQPAGLGIIDISDPLNPVTLDYIQAAGTSSGSGIVKTEGNFAYLGAMKQGLAIFDISNKNSITFMSRVVPTINWPVNHPPNPDFYNARGLEVRNSIVYLCYDAGGVRIINCTDKLNPVETGRWCNPAMYSPINYTRAYNNILLSGSYAYVTVDYCGMEILDISDTSAIQMKGWWNPYHCPDNNWFTSQVHANELFLNESCNQVFLATGKSDMIVVDISDPQHPDSCNYFGGVENGIGTWGINGYGSSLFLSYLCVPLSIPFASDWTGVKILSYQLCNAAIAEQNKLTISVSPNPATTYFRLRCSQSQTNLRMKIIDAYGRIVTEKIQIEGNETIVSTSELNPGLYFIELSNDDQIYTLRLIISTGN